MSDFVVGLTRTNQGDNAIWVVVDRLTKSSHYILVTMSISMNKLIQL